MRPIVFDQTKEFKTMGTAGRVPKKPWEVTCGNCSKQDAFKIERNNVLIIDRIGMRLSDMYKCMGCGRELYDVVQYLPATDGWSTLESYKQHYPDNIRYIDIDQLDLLHRLVNMVDVTEPTQRLSTVSLMLSSIWDILNNMMKQAKMKGDMNSYDLNTMMGKSIELRDKVHACINALRG